MAFIAKYMTVLGGQGKSLYSCVLRRGRGRSRKSLIDMMLERSCILMAGIELCKYA